MLGRPMCKPVALKCRRWGVFSSKCTLPCIFQEATTIEPHSSFVDILHRANESLYSIRIYAQWKTFFTCFGDNVAPCILKPDLSVSSQEVKWSYETKWCTEWPLIESEQHINRCHQRLTVIMLVRIRSLSAGGELVLKWMYTDALTLIDCSLTR